MKFSSKLDTSLNSLTATKEAYIRLQQEAGTLSNKHNLKSEIDSIVNHLRTADNRTDWRTYARTFDRYQKEVHNAAYN